MASHAYRREAGGQQSRGKGSEFKTLAALRARSYLRPGTPIVPEITSIVHQPLAGAAARGQDPLEQEGPTVQVRRLSRGFTACTVSA
jgi:hypothetical protein